MNEDAKRGRSRSAAFDFAVSWMNKFALNADSMPTNGVRNLPSCLTKDAVFKIYEEEMKEKDRPCLAKSTFLYNMWKEKFPDVVIPKVNSRDCNLFFLYSSTSMYAQGDMVL